MKKVTSREYQCRLLLSRFARGEEDAPALFQTLQKLDANVRFDESQREALRFEQYFLDDAFPGSRRARSDCDLGDLVRKDSRGGIG